MRKSVLSDHELVMAYVDGHHASFEILLNRHKSAVRAYIMKLVRDTTVAEDIFQDTFIKVINTLKSGKYTDEGKFLPWVNRIAHNLVIDYFRKNKRMPMYNSPDEDFDIFSTIKIYDNNIEDRIIRNQLHNSMHKFIEKLPKEQKEVLYMRHFGDLSFNEIAEQTNVSINTALGRMRYALINLRKMMEKSNISLVE